MDQNDLTKNGPKESPSQAEPGPAEPDAMQQESPRVCKICGGPNHYGCGCEAKQKQAAVQVETENIGADKTSAIVEAVKVDEKLKELALDFAGAKVAAEIIRSEAEQITRLLSDILEVLKTIHTDLVRDKVQNDKSDQN